MARISNGMVRRTGLATLGAALGVVLAACGTGPTATSVGEASPAPAESAIPQPSATPTPFKPELVICAPAEPDALIGSAPPAGAAIAALVSGRAVTYGAGYQAQTGLLRALPSEADGTLRRNDDGTLSVTLQYREDLTWSDGEPFKAADAILGFRAGPVPGQPTADILDAQEGDALTIQLTLAPGAEYSYIPAQPPLPSHILAGVDPAQIAASDYARTVNPSLGPYFVAEWAPGSYILLNANPYFVPQPQIPVVRVGFVSDPNQAVNAVSEETCDVVLDGGLGIDQLAALDQAAAGGAVRVYKWAGSLRDEIVINTYPGVGGRIPYFADTAVRQAVAYAFDRASAVQQMYGGAATLLDGWIPPEHWAAGGGAYGNYGLDANRAGALLDQAGWRDEDGDGIREYHGTGGEYSCQRGSWSVEEKAPLTPTLLIPDGNAQRLALAQKLQADLRAVGIGLQIQPVSPSSMFALTGPVQRREFDMALISMAVEPDPDGISQWVGADVYRHPLDRSAVHRWQLENRWLESEQLVEWLAPSNVPSPDNDWQGQNYSGWCNEAADIAVVEASLLLDPSARAPHYSQVEALTAADVPAIPLASRPRYAASKTYVCGLQPGPYDPLTWNSEAWWFDPQGTCGS